MGLYVCRCCSATVESEDMPQICPRCYRPAAEAFGVGQISQDQDRADREPIKPRIAQISTLELEEADLVADEEAASPARAGVAKQAYGKGEISTTPAGSSSSEDREPIKPRIAQISTLELDEADLMAPSADGSEATAAKQEKAAAPPPRPVSTSELEEMIEEGDVPAASAAPTTAPRRQRSARPLTSQTASLVDGLHAKRRRRALALVWMVAFIVAGYGAYRLLRVRHGPTHRGFMESGEPLMQISVVDSSPPRPPPDLTSDVVDGGAYDLVVDVPPRKPRPRRPPAKNPTGALAAKPRPVASPESLYRQGLQQLLVSKPAKAIVLFNKVLKQSPGFALAYRGLGLAYEKLGRKPLAAAAYNRYLILRPTARDAGLIRSRLERLR